MRAPPDRWLPRSRRGEACTTGMEEGGRGLLCRIADRQAGKGGRHRRIADRRALEEGKIKGSAAGLPVVATRGGKRPYQPSLAFVHPFPLGTPKVDSPSQRRQGTAERGKCRQTVSTGGGGIAARTQVGCRATGRRRICGQADIYFFVSERYECSFYIIVIGTYIVFILIQISCWIRHNLAWLPKWCILCRVEQE